MNPEAKLSSKTVKGLRPFGNLHSVIRIESGLTLRGIPDINYAFTFSKRGWMELKCLSVMPKTKTRLTKWTPDQRLFAKRRIAAGEKVFFFLEAGKEYFLFDAIDIASLTELTPLTMRKLAKGHWVKTINFKELYEIL